MKIETLRDHRNKSLTINLKKNNNSVVENGTAEERVITYKICLRFLSERAHTWAKVWTV